MLENGKYGVVITGDMYFDDREYFNAVCEKYILGCGKKKEDIVLILGDNKPLWNLGSDFAEKNGLEILKISANWDKYKKKAGWFQLGNMLDRGNICLLFEGKDIDKKWQDLIKKYEREIIKKRLVLRKIKKYMDTEYIIAIRNLPGVGLKTLHKVFKAFIDSGQQVISQSDMWKFLDTLDYLSTTKEEFDKNCKESREIIKTSNSLGIKILNWFDQSYPALLRTLDMDAPGILYYKGDLSILNNPCLAIIGTRTPTLEGTKAAEWISSGFSKVGVNIVSGLAKGCDTSGHLGALKAGGVTTAILAHGLDQPIYPKQNSDLAEKILDSGGLLISEYDIGKTLEPYQLAERSRLQAGLSDATVVIQSSPTGGTRHAAMMTTKLNRSLFVVKYENPDIMNDPNVKGNDVFVSSLGGKYITSRIEDMETIYNILKR